MAFSMHDLELLVAQINEIAWGWPLVIFFVASALILTVGLGFVQFRYFFTSWRYAFAAGESHQESTESYITPFQAFINALSASIGNGSAAGMATAVFAGGPGVGFWIFFLGFFNLAIRFAEVFASVHFVEKSSAGALRGGPMVYLKMVPGGSFLPAAYAFFCLLLAFFSGNAMQCQSIATGINNLFGVSFSVIAVVLFLFLLYLMLGGARRIMYFAEKVIPIKVGLFFIATIIALLYHWQSLIPAIKLIIQSALTPQAIRGVLIGFTVRDAIRFGISRSSNATEIGLGTAAILFGATRSKDAKRTGIMSMATAFISNHLVCSALVLLLVASGVWNSGLESTPLTQAAYATVFHSWGGFIVTFLTITFGVGVLIAYAYMGRECWSFLTGGRFMWLYIALYCIMAVFGTLAKVKVVWSAIDIVNAGLLAINLFGLLWLLPKMRRALKNREPQHIITGK